MTGQFNNSFISILSISWACIFVPTKSDNYTIKCSSSLISRVVIFIVHQLKTNTHSESDSNDIVPLCQVFDVI